MVQSNLAIEELAQTGLASLERAWLVWEPTSPAGSTPQNTVSSSGLQMDPNMFCDHLDDRNMKAESIICFGHFWLSTYSLCF